MSRALDESHPGGGVVVTRIEEVVQTEVLVNLPQKRCITFTDVLQAFCHGDLLALVGADPRAARYEVSCEHTVPCYWKGGHAQAHLVGEGGDGVGLGAS